MPEIKRENSPYGGMKWKLIIHLSESGNKSIRYYRTRKEAAYAGERWNNADHDKFTTQNR